MKDMDYREMEGRVAAWSRLPGKRMLIDSLEPEWRKVGKQRARTLRRRGQHVEWSPQTGSYVWLRRLDTVKMKASNLYGIPYAQVTPQIRRASKAVLFMEMYGGPGAQ